MRFLLSAAFSFAISVAAAQHSWDPASFYTDAPRATLLETKGPVRALAAASWPEWYQRSYDSIVRTWYPSGNLQTEEHFTRPWGQFSMSWTYRDNDRREPLRVDKAGPGGKAEPYQEIRYDSTGMAEVTWLENGIPQRRSFRRVLDPKGRVLDETRFLGRQEEYHYQFDYDASGRKQEERHLDPNGILADAYSFRYDLHGWLIQEIHKRPGDKIEDMQLHDYDTKGRRIRTSFFEAGYYLDRYATYAYDSAGRKTEESSYYANGTLSGHSIYRYDAAGDLLESSWGNAPEVDRRVTFDANGHTLQDFQWSGETRSAYVAGLRLRDSLFIQGQFRQIRSYRYDAQGRLEEEKTDGTTIQYAYGRCPGPDTVTTTSGEGPRYRRSQRSIIRYNSHCQPVDVLVLPAPPPPDVERHSPQPSGPLRYRFEYDRKGRPKKESLFDRNDTPLYSIQWTYEANGARTVVLQQFGPAGPVGSTESRFDKEGLLRSFSQRSGGRELRHSYSYEFDSRGNWIRREGRVTGESASARYELALRTIRYDGDEP
ncbi:RHS repeat domain-containing protein [Flaviaesturariibacter terrae]